MWWCGVVHAFTALALSLDLRAIQVVEVDCPETVRHWPSEVDGDQNPKTVLYGVYQTPTDCRINVLINDHASRQTGRSLPSVQLDHAFPVHARECSQLPSSVCAVTN